MSKPATLSKNEATLCASLSNSLKTAGNQAWNANWKQVYALAEAHMRAVVQEWSQNGSKL